MKIQFLVACTSWLLLLGAAAPAQAQDDLDALFGDSAEDSSSQDAEDSSEQSGGTTSSGESASEPESGSADSPQVISLPEKAAPEVARPRPANRLVEEIVVTAQKREESLQDVPISVQAFSDEKLDALGITDQDDLQQLVPSLNISKLLSFTTIYLRGIGTDAFLTADPSVATYIDGIYFPFAMGLSQDFGVLERIEVLKGPQGTLFGRNTTGGALNIVTRDPQLGEWDGQFNITTASYPDLHTKAYLNVPIGDEIAFTVSPVYAKTKHYIKNVNPNQRKPLEEDTSKGVRVKLRWAPTQWFDVTLGALDIVTRAPSANLIPATTATDLAVALGAEREQYRPGSDKASLDGCCDNYADNRVYYGTAQFFTPWFDVKLLGSDQFITTGTLIDFDGTEDAIAQLNTDQFDADIQSAELQLISNASSWGSDWLRWIYGAYYFDGLAGFIDPGTRLNATFINREGADDLIGVLDPVTGGVDPDNAFATFLVETKSVASFLQGTVTLTNWLDITLGLRYQDESREMLESRTGTLVNGEEVTTEDRDTAEKQDGTEIGPFHSEQTWAPKISFETRPFGDDTLVYLNYQQATKSGTYNGLAINGPATFADPESVNAWELGTKASFLFGTLQFNGAIFDYDLENLQVQFVSLSTGGSVSFENAKAAKIRGMDFDVLWVIAPHLIDGLVVTGGLGWLETAEYTAYPNATGYTDNSGTSEETDFSGNRIVKTPKISGNFAIAKSWNLWRGTLETAVNVYHTDEFFNEPSNRELTIQPSYQTYGARISYLYEPLNIRTTLFGANLTDQYHTRGIQPADFGDLTTIGAPRTVGLRLSWKY